MLPRKCTIFICVALTGSWVFCLVYARSLCVPMVCVLLPLYFYWDRMPLAAASGDSPTKNKD